MSASTYLLFRTCITRPTVHASIRPRISSLCIRPLSTVQNSDWRLLSCRGRRDAHTSARPTARRLPRRDSPSHEASAPPESSSHEDLSPSEPSSHPDPGPSEPSGAYGTKARVVTYAILGVNTIVFGAWYMAKNAYSFQRDRRQVDFMVENFTASLANLKAGRVWTLMTATFSHSELWHFGMNSACIYFFAPLGCQILGPGTFIAFYLTSGIISSLTSIGWNSGVKDRKTQALGASGALYGLTSLVACLFPHAEFLILGIIPAPAWACVGGFLALDFLSALSPNPRPLFDSAGHIGGAMSGFAYYLIQRRRYRRLLRR